MAVKVIVIYTWITSLICYSVQVPFQKNDGVIIIDQIGLSAVQCCMYGNCHCSNLSLALEHIQDNTEIRIQSGISLRNAVVFGNISNVKITGDSNPTVRCDHRGGLVGKNINYIVIQGITWDSCNGIEINGFSYSYITSCKFQHSIEFTVKFNGYLDSSLLIEKSVFSHNGGGISASASSTIVNKCDFINNVKNHAALSMHDSDKRDSTKVVISGSNFVGNSGQALSCFGTIFLHIYSSYFINNTCSAATLTNCQMVISNVTFFNNKMDTTLCIPLSCRFNFEPTSACGGAGINLYNSTLNITGSVSFLNNWASGNGGAIYTSEYSSIYFYQTTAKFINNTAKNGGAVFTSKGSSLHVSKSYLMFASNMADNGGAIYIDKELGLHVNKRNTDIEFINNTAISYGGAVYANGFTNDNVLHYYQLLLNVKHLKGNVAYEKGDYIYFNSDEIGELMCNPELPKHSSLFASSLCSLNLTSAIVRVNKSDHDNCSSVLFWTQDFKFDATFMDYLGQLSVPVNVTVRINQNCSDFGGHDCCEGYDGTFDYIIDYINNNTIMVTNNTLTCGCFSDGKSINNSIIHMKFDPWVNGLLQLNINLTDTSNDCSDMAHYYNHSGDCVTLSCDRLSKRFTYLLPGLECPLGHLTVTPGYWYDNSFKQYIFSCIYFCNFNNWYNKILLQSHPDRDLQCIDNWGGFACGECNYSASYSIIYDTLKCVPVNECLITSEVHSLLILFGVSFFYWILVIAFIFVLLHFNVKITAGSAYGLIFYYSVQENIFNVFKGVIHTRHCAIPEKESFYYDCLLGPVDFSGILQFFLVIGNLKPPFLQYMNLCMGSAEIIDHLFLQYIHPMIVVLVVSTVYLLGRNSVTVCEIIGRYINSKSICLFLLLSYSTISHVSLQLLIPLPYFKPDRNDVTIPYGTLSGWKVYWSPRIQYFYHRHIFYFIVAILCELIIGIGFPVILLLQRQLTRNFNINVFGMKHIVDELQGCYKNGHYFFTAYYLICRQVIYVVNILSYMLLWMFSMEPVLIELITMLSVCSFVLVVHLWFQPYEKRSMNILDAAILSTLVLQLVCSLDGKSYGIVIVFWILPLLFFINYLTYSTKLRHIIALCSICAVTLAICLLVFLQNISGTGSFYYLSVVSMLLLLLCFCLLISYILVMLSNFIRPCDDIAEEHHIQIGENDRCDDGNGDNDTDETPNEDDSS